MFFDPTKPYDDKETMRLFNLDLLPWLTKHGPEVGEKAMQGDLEAENIIRRYGIFCSWKDPVNLAMLRNQISAWAKRH